MRALVHVTRGTDPTVIARAAPAAGYAFEFVYTPDALLGALERSTATSSTPDLVIVLSDGAGAGLEAIDAVKADPIFWPTPVCVLARGVTDAERIAAYDAGAGWYREMPRWVLDAKRFLRRLPLRLTATPGLEQQGVVAIAAADMIEEIETFLMSQA